MVRTVVSTGLLIAALGFCALIVTDTETGGDHRDLLKKVVLAGGVIVAVGLGLGALSHLRTLRFGRGCARCGRTVRSGHIYCEDHFLESVHRARDQRS